MKLGLSLFTLVVEVGLVIVVGVMFEDVVWVELVVVDVVDDVIAKVEEIVVDDVIVAELELVVPVSTEMALLCVELVEVALVEGLVDVALRVVVSSTGKNLATPRLVIGARS